jgi:hypothetical protein
MSATTADIGRIGDRCERARYSVPVGERVLYGQRVDGVVRFLPGSNAVLVAPSGLGEDDGCCLREAPLGAGRPNAARHKRLNGAGAEHEPRDQEGS